LNHSLNKLSEKFLKNLKNSWLHSEIGS